jgi:hypothetical protein
LHANCHSGDPTSLKLENGEFSNFRPRKKRKFPRRTAWPFFEGEIQGEPPTATNKNNLSKQTPLRGEQRSKVKRQMSEIVKKKSPDTKNNLESKRQFACNESPILKR